MDTIIDLHRLENETDFEWKLRCCIEIVMLLSQLYVSEGVHSNETLPSFILQNKLRKIKEKLKNDKIRVN